MNPTPPQSERERLKLAVWKHLDLLVDVASPERVAENLADFIIQEKASARLEELRGIQKYWLDLSMVVPRLQASPPPVKQYIAERVAALTPKTTKEDI